MKTIVKTIIIVFAAIILTTSIGILICRLNTPQDMLSGNENSVILNFPNGAKIYVRAKNWGVAGNHEEIVFSEVPITIPNKENDYIFYTNEVFYKMEDNVLTIYASESDISNSTPLFNDVKVVFKGLKNADIIRDYNLNYQKYNLKKISVYDN
jgi:hypothetical protein